MSDELKAGETKAEVFKRLATRRTQQVLTSLRVLGNCSTRANYEYTPEQIEKILTAINSAVVGLEERFKPSAKAEAERFTI